MIDHTVVKVSAGKGGDGAISFRREKFIAKGGPNGGDGGKGGDVYLQVNQNLTTLMDFKSRADFKAENGGRGSKNKRKGADGHDLILQVPAGTQIKVQGKNSSRPTLVKDLFTHGEVVLIALGGRGGRGNFQFKSSTNRTPMQATRGEQGQGIELTLEIKLIADIGLIGLPNAGKSTLLNALTKASAKVGAYPFTTIEPNLGVMLIPERGLTLVLADLPGLIEGAAEGRGLGDEFLRHVERTKLLVHIIDPSSSDPIEAYHTVRKELKEYKGADLSGKKELVVINKCDIPEVKDNSDEYRKEFKKLGIKPYFVSAAGFIGLDELRLAIADEFLKMPTEPISKLSHKVYTVKDLPNKRIVFREKSNLIDLSYDVEGD